MNVHEYQAKRILFDFGVSVPAGALALSAAEAYEAASSIGGETWAVKAQIHAGGRGKAGGVRLCRSPHEVEIVSAEMIGRKLVTKQTGAEGREVHRLWIEQGLNIKRELYLSLLVDRQHECVSFMLSPDGGMDIEQVAVDSPERILHRQVNVQKGLQTGACIEMASFLGLEGEQTTAFSSLATSLYTAFMSTDASLIELNPLVLTQEDNLVALDAKMSFDDNAIYRHKDIQDLRDMDEEDAHEAEAAQFGLNYISLDGTIGCMVNGAGLAMATMDIIQLKGQRPANFLDVGGGVTEEAATEGFRLLFSNDHLKAILVNIFGGIVRCDIIARGLIRASEECSMRVPVILRLVGTHEEDGKHLIHTSGLDVQWAHDLDEAAEFAAAAARVAST